MSENLTDNNPCDKIVWSEVHTRDGVQIFKGDVPEWVETSPGHFVISRALEGITRWRQTPTGYVVADAFGKNGECYE